MLFFKQGEAKLVISIFFIDFIAIKEIAGSIPKTCQLYYMGQGSVPGLSSVHLQPLLEKSPTYPPPEPITRFTGTVAVLYIEPIKK